jgi:predicted SAM-dependent methyltransferase
MKAYLKAALQALNIYRPVSQAWIATEPRLVRASRALTGRNTRLTAKYFSEHTVKKLHVGCGGNELAGWLNTELCPRGSQIFLDATRPFPFPSGTFRYIYTEHMIEHISLRDAERMLDECFRVMTPGGVIRIVTPDLEFVTSLLQPNPSPRVRAYIEYSIEAHRIHAARADAVSVFNNFVRAWGHQYIHSPESLGALLAAAGFQRIERAALNTSAHPELTGLAKADRMPSGFVEMESFVLEGTKPG